MEKIEELIKKELAKAENNHEVFVRAEEIKDLVDELVENYQDVAKFNIG